MSGRHAVRRVGEQRQAEAQHAVGAELQHHSRQDHGACGGGVGVRVGQPSVEREQRNLDGKGKKESKEEQEFGARRQ